MEETSRHISEITGKNDKISKQRTKRDQIQERDMVFLSTKNVDTTRPSKKLDHKMIGPFKILRDTNGSYELDLPESMKQKYAVFHPSLLRKASTDPLPGQEEQPAPPIIVRDEEHFKVDEILDARRYYRKVQFKAKWKGYPIGHPENDVWYYADDFVNAREIFDDFYSRNPTKPRWNPPPEDAD
jgi:hypothetical protein